MKRHYDFYNYNSLNKNCISLELGISFDIAFKDEHKFWAISIMGFRLESYLEAHQNEN